MAGIYVSGVGSSFEAPVVKKNANAEKANSIGSKKDRLDISEQGKDFLLVCKSLGEVPDIRAEKAEPIKAAYQAGVYSVSAADVADKILSEFRGFQQ